MLKIRRSYRPSYLQHGNPHTWERRSLYWDGALTTVLWCDPCNQLCIFKKDWEVSNPVISLLLLGLPSHSDNTPWSPWSGDGWGAVINEGVVAMIWWSKQWCQPFSFNSLQPGGPICCHKTWSGFYTKGRLLVKSNLICPSDKLSWQPGCPVLNINIQGNFCIS